jgi:hypothetical protein
MDENCIYWYIPVYVVDILVYTCIYHYSYPVTGFRGGHCDAAMLDASQPPVEQEPEEGDPSPCPAVSCCLVVRPMRVWPSRLDN